MNHAKAILACDFFVAVTASFRLFYVFVVIEHASRRLVRVDVTAHPGAGWTLQPLRDVVGVEILTGICFTIGTTSSRGTWMSRSRRWG